MSSGSLLPGAEGECGHQHENKSCLPMQGRTCCSINGYCGFNETYCFESNGCQSGCVDPIDFYMTSSTLVTTTTAVSEAANSTFISSLKLSSTSHLTTISTSTVPPRITSGVPAPSGSTIPSSNSTAITHKQGLHGAARTGAIAGGAVGGVAVLLLIACLLIFCRNGRPKPSKVSSGSSSSTNTAAPAVRDVSGFNQGANAQQGFRVKERGER
ncbi:hypothetical protein DL95DRAFT_464977 [Leptodontidium sp. 2 PMI_412]|nr:hypothetical protein DL95DRAFT_464977 [Leptodontidium sp. 2 PMI_412]